MEVNKDWKIVQIRQEDDMADMVSKVLKCPRWYTCPNCRNMDITKDYNYCPRCGYQINWIIKN